MNTLCFGGSFNPIHHGHLITARSAAESLGFDKVLLIPTGQSPHKPYHSDFAKPHERLAMCQAAVASSDLFEVSDLEIMRTGPSYTLLTVRELQKNRVKEAYVLDAAHTPIDTPTHAQGVGSDDKIAWLIGADMLNFLPNWHEPAALLAEVRFIILARPGHVFNWTGLPAEYQHLKANVVETPLIDICSTHVRQRVRAGLSINYLTPPGVVDYIRTNGLYRD